MFVLRFNLTHFCPDLARQRSNAPYFETVIRYLGGLLSAYHLTKDHRLLQKADGVSHTMARF